MLAPENHERAQRIEHPLGSRFSYDRDRDRQRRERDEKDRLFEVAEHQVGEARDGEQREHRLAKRAERDREPRAGAPGRELVRTFGREDRGGRLMRSIPVNENTAITHFPITRNARSRSLPLNARECAAR